MVTTDDLIFVTKQKGFRKSKLPILGSTLIITLCIVCVLTTFCAYQKKARAISDGENQIEEEPIPENRNYRICVPLQRHVQTLEDIREAIIEEDENEIDIENHLIQTDGKFQQYIPCHIFYLYVMEAIIKRFSSLLRIF